MRLRGMIAGAAVVSLGAAALWRWDGLGLEPGSPPSLSRTDSDAAVALRRATLLADQGRWADAEAVAASGLAAEGSDEADTEPRRDEIRLRTLILLGFLRTQLNDASDAEAAFREAVALGERLFPADRFPQGHPLLAESLSHLGDHLLRVQRFDEAETVLNRAADEYRRLYPPELFPQGHVEHARMVGLLGMLSLARGDLPEADDRLERCANELRAVNSPFATTILAVALAERSRLQVERGAFDAARDLATEALSLSAETWINPPPVPNPSVGPATARALNTLGVAAFARGDWPRSRLALERALGLLERLYPASTFPEGHPLLAETLLHLAAPLAAQGETTAAREVVDRAVTMPKAPRDAARAYAALAELAASLGETAQAVELARRAFDEAERWRENVGTAESDRLVAGALASLAEAELLAGNRDDALRHARRSLSIRRRIFVPPNYPAGHEELAAAHDALAGVLTSQGQLADAREQAAEAHRIRRGLYDARSFSDGHPALLRSRLLNAELALAAGDPGEAARHATAAAQTYERLAWRFFEKSSEAEALNYADQARMADTLLSVRATSAEAVGDRYRLLAPLKGALLDVVRQRWRNVARHSDPAVRAAYGDYLRVRRELSAAAHSNAENNPARTRRLLALNREKERLERRLATAAARSGERRAESRAPSLPKLAAGTLFVDLWRWTPVADSEPVPRYTAFVLAPRAEVARVDLGPAAPIDEAVREWRREIATGGEERHGERLAELLWAPIAAHVPPETAIVHVSADGTLHRIPWAAIPDVDGDRVLLERFAIAMTAGARFLRPERDPRPEPSSHGAVLVVGNVDYGGSAEGTGRPQWSSLPGTAREIEEVAAAAGERPVVRLAGRDATADRLLEELPRVRWAHLATHGFFEADATARGAGADRASPLARSPLLRTGLVLAGANDRRWESAAPLVPRPGVLSGEDVAALSLPNLELVVLSACDTGLGDTAGGEGAFGLQRAFRAAGARNVVAGLWRVDDEAAVAVARVFLHELWREGRPPIHALRAAQLAVHRAPDLVPRLARTRGPSIGEVVAAPAARRTDHTAETRLWAAFALYGEGR